MKRFLNYFWGTIVHPSVTFEALAAEQTVRWAFAVASLPVLQIWGNVSIHYLFGLDWLGTKPILLDPTFVAGFGHWRIAAADWVPVFVVLMPFLSLLEMVLYAGLAHLLSKLWGGKGTFEQMVNTLAFATIVPSMVVAASSEWIFGVPIDLISGHPYWWNAAMQGEFGPVIGTIWNFYVFGVYLGVQWIWIIVLGSIAIRRIQHIPRWAAILTMLAAFSFSMLLSSVFVR